MTEFLIDENILGIDRYLDGNVKYKKVGDTNCPAKGASDPNVAKFAETNNLIIVTTDEKLKKQCELSNIECVFLDQMKTLAEKVLQYEKQ